MDAPSPRDDAPQNPPSTGSPSTWGTLALAGVAGIAGFYLLSGPSLPPPAPNHPLPECRTSTNCERTSRSYAVPADTLFAAARQAMASLGPIAQRGAPDALRASATYRVGGVFKDDLTAAVTAQEKTSTLHVRSTSRIGLYDFGVNRRRVRNVLDAVDRELSETRADAIKNSGSAGPVLTGPEDPEIQRYRAVAIRK